MNKTPGLNISFTQRDLGLANAVKMTARLRDSFVMVGLPGVGSPPAIETVYQDGKAVGTRPSGMTVAALGVIHEYGSPSNNIPSRPFMRQTWGRSRWATLGIIRQMYLQITSPSKKMSIRQALGVIGAFYEGRVKDTLVNGTFAPLKRATVVRKGSSKPLIDTGLMRNSVTHKVHVGA